MVLIDFFLIYLKSSKPQFLNCDCHFDSCDKKETSTKSSSFSYSQYEIRIKMFKV